MEIEVLEISYRGNVRWWNKGNNARILISELPEGFEESDFNGKGIVNGENSVKNKNVYSLKEGETVISNFGHKINIGFIDADEVAFTINGERVPNNYGKLLVEQTNQLSDGYTIKVIDISKLEVAGEVGRVNFLIFGSSTQETVFEGDVTENMVSIVNIDENTVTFDVNGEFTHKLEKGSIYGLNSGDVVEVNEIHNLEVSGEVGNVLFTLYSKKLIPSSTEVVTYQGVLNLIGAAKNSEIVWLGHSSRNGKTIIVTNGHKECGFSKCLLGMSYINEIPIELIDCNEKFDFNKIRLSDGYRANDKYQLQYLCASP